MLKGRARGFTLIELMVVIALLAIMATIAVPNFINFIRNNEIHSRAEETFRLLQFARGEAITKRVRVEVRTADSEWSVWMKSAGSNSYEKVRSMSFDPSKTVLRTTALTSDKIVYSANGTATPASITVCYQTEAANGYFLQVQPSGFNQLHLRGLKDAAGTKLTSCTL